MYCYKFVIAPISLLKLFKKENEEYKLNLTEEGYVFNNVITHIFFNTTYCPIRKSEEESLSFFYFFKSDCDFVKMITKETQKRLID